MAISNETPKRAKEVMHDETPSMITGHAFEPTTEWWSLCKICRMSEAAHVRSTLTSHFEYYEDEPQM